MSVDFVDSHYDMFGEKNTFLCKNNRQTRCFYSKSIMYSIFDKSNMKERRLLDVLS